MTSGISNALGKGLTVGVCAVLGVFGRTADANEGVFGTSGMAGRGRTVFFCGCGGRGSSFLDGVVAVNGAGCNCLGRAGTAGVLGTVNVGRSRAERGVAESPADLSGLNGERGDVKPRKTSHVADRAADMSPTDEVGVASVSFLLAESGVNGRAAEMGASSGDGNARNKLPFAQSDETRFRSMVRPVLLGSSTLTKC